MSHQKKINIFLLLLLFSFGYSCDKLAEEKNMPEYFSGYSNVSTFSDSPNQLVSIEFTEKTLFDDLDSMFFTEIAQVGVDRLDRAYLSNDEAIHIYNNNGNYIRSVGRKGRGPGEFQVIHNFKVKDGKLYVYDANMSRISIFNLNTFELDNELSLSSKDGMIGLGEFGVRNDGSLILGMVESRKKQNSIITEKYMHYYSMDSSGKLSRNEIVTTKLSDYFELENRNGTSYPPIPFDRTTKFSLSISDKMYLAWTDEIAIKVFDLSGNYIKGIYYPFENVEISDDNDFPGAYKVLDIVTDTKRVLGKRMPDTHPAIAHFFVDDMERIWLSTIVSNREVYEWWVLKESGELLAKFTWPRQNILKVVKNGFAYAVDSDEKTGESILARYKINWIE